MLPYPWLAVLITGFLLALANSPNSGPPRGLSANRLGAQIRALPDYAHFSYSGLAFYKGILHVSTNFGLLEVKNGKIDKGLSISKKDSVVSGPWLDQANQ